jgi:hypothetical protein
MPMGGSLAKSVWNWGQTPISLRAFSLAAVRTNAAMVMPAKAAAREAISFSSTSIVKSKRAKVFKVGFQIQGEGLFTG